MQFKIFEVIVGMQNLNIELPNLLIKVNLHHRTSIVFYDFDVWLFDIRNLKSTDYES